MLDNLTLTSLLNTTSKISLLPFTLPLFPPKNGEKPPQLLLLLWTALPILIAYIFLYRLQSTKSHPSEPPILAPRIPYIGHLLGMALHGGRYTKRLGLANPSLPIFTLPVPAKSRIYIVTDPILAAAVQRASKALSFTPLVPDLTKRILGLDNDTVKIVRRHLDPEPGQERGFLADIHDMVYSYLGPGSELNELSLDATRQLAGEVNDFVITTLALGTGAGVEVNLLHWIRHFVTVATAKFLYGPENPLTSSTSSPGSDSGCSERKGLEQAFWDFDGGIGRLLMGIFPSITARKPYLGREKLAAAMANYLEAGKWKSASKIVQNRVEIALRHGWTLGQASRSEVSFLFAGIVNTATTTFWVVLQVFASQEGLLSTVRKELEGVVTEVDEDGRRKRVLSLNKVKNGAACPTLMAVFRECLRVGSDNYSTRLVKADTMLAGRYFLKKDSVVQIAGGVMHADERIWGRDAGVFNPGRFLSPSSSSSSSGKSRDSKGENGGDEEHESGTGNGTTTGTSGNVHPAAFRAFGGGKTLCPGRHFATNEILAFVAMIVLTFDLEPVVKANGGGKIKVPGKDDNVLPVHILEPKEDVFVRVLLRDCQGDQYGAGENTYKRIEVIP